jgi:hypothetical protein
MRTPRCCRVGCAVFLALAVSWVWADAQTAQTTPTSQAPAQQKPKVAPLTVKKDLPKGVGAISPTGTGRYEVTGVDIHIQGATPFSGYRPTTQNLVGDSPDDSVIVVRGTVHGGGVLAPNGTDLATSFHVQFKNWNVFPNLPPACAMAVVSYPQSTKAQTSYVAYFAIKDTAHKTECWTYFAGLKTLEVEILHVKTQPHPAIPAQPLTDGGKRVLDLGQRLPKTPAQ